MSEAERRILEMAVAGPIAVQVHEDVRMVPVKVPTFFSYKEVRRPARSVDMQAGDLPLLRRMAAEGLLTEGEPLEMMHLSAEPSCIEARLKDEKGRVWRVSYAITDAGRAFLGMTDPDYDESWFPDEDDDMLEWTA